MKTAPLMLSTLVGAVQKRNSMNKLYKIAIVLAAVALGSAAISADALARGGGGGGHGGGGHVGGFGGGHMGSFGGATPVAHSGEAMRVLDSPADPPWADLMAPLSAATTLADIGAVAIASAVSGCTGLGTAASTTIMVRAGRSITPTLSPLALRLLPLADGRVLGVPVIRFTKVPGRMLQRRIDRRAAGPWPR